MALIIVLIVIANFLNCRKKTQTYENGSNKRIIDIGFNLNSNKLTLVSLLEKQLTTEIMADNITFSFIPLTYE